MISLLNKLGRRRVSDRGEKLNNPRLFSSTAKRVLSVLFLLILGFSFLPTFDINVSAATPGFSNVSYSRQSDGSVLVKFTGTPNLINSTLGSFSSFNMYVTAQSDGYRTAIPSTSRKLTSGAYNTVFTAEAVFWMPENGDWKVQLQGFDTTSGQSIGRVGHEVILTDLKYNTAARTKPSLAVTGASPHATDKTAIVFYTALWWGGSRRVTKIEWFLGDADGNLMRKTNSVTNPVNCNTDMRQTITGLTPGMTYTVWYTITNGLEALGTGMGTTTSPKYKVTPGTPSEPTNRRSIPGNGSITYTWDPPTNLNGATISGYNIYLAGSTTPLNTSLISATNRTFTYSPLTNGQLWYSNTAWVTSITSDGKEGTRGALSAIWVGSPQPVANACCIMLNS